MNNNKDFAENSHLKNQNQSSQDETSVDPSNTSNIGQKVETGVVSKKEGISKQSGEWEDIQERGIPGQEINIEAERYIKNPAPEEADHEDARDETLK